jgi:hypothetical protein
MLFLSAIDKFNREELLDLLAFAQAATFLASMRQPTEAMVAKTKKSLETAGKTTSSFLTKLRDKTNGSSNRISSLCARGLGAMARGSGKAACRLEEVSFTPFQLAEQIKEEREKLQARSTDELRQQLISLLAKLGKVSGNKRQNPLELSLKIISEAARALKIDTRLISPEDVERLVFEKYVENLIAQIRKRLQKEGPKFEDQLEKELRELLEKMSAGEQEAIKKAMGLDQLTAKALLNIFKSGGAALAVLVGLNAAGFGLFLAAVTTLQAITLLTGLSLGFGPYMVTTTILGFMTGPLGMVLTTTLASGTAGLWQYRKHRRNLLLNLVATMHYRLTVNDQA